MPDFKSFSEFQGELHSSEQRPAAVQPKTAEEDTERKSRHHFHGSSGHRWKQYGISGFIICICIIMGILFLPVPFGDIRLTGNDKVTRDDILFDGAVEMPLNVWQIRTSELEDRLSRDVRIGQVSVTRSFPLHIDIQIEEREPVAVIQEEFGYALLDNDGTVVRTVSTLRNVNLPMITGVKLDNKLLGDVVQNASVISALEFLGGLSQKGIESFSEINMGNPEHIVAYTRDGVPVWLENGKQMNDRAVLAEKMLKDMRMRNLAVEYVGVNLNSPYFKMKE